jgi:hypothetical protein
MTQNIGTSVQLPERVTLNLTAQDVVTILGALQDTGPYKAVLPVIRAVEQQVLSQQIRPQVSVPAPVAPPPPGEPAA